MFILDVDTQSQKSHKLFSNTYTVYVAKKLAIKR